MLIALALHVVAALVWVGGLFFILAILRPASIRIEPPQRFRLFAKVFQWFFPWVWGAIAVLLVSGYAMLLWGAGIGAVPSVLMQVLGIAMMLMFGHLYRAVYPHFRRAVEAENWAQTNFQANRMRQVLRIMLWFGLATVVIGATGRLWG